jgi:hypothetical protein
MYEADAGAWNQPAHFTQRSALVSATGPGLTADMAHGGLRVAYYRGSFPTDDDTWGIYNLLADSTGIGPDLRAMSDTAVGTVILRADAAGNPGMLWSDETGAGMDMYASVWFSRMDGDTWLPRQLVAAGMGSPANVDCHIPAMCRDTAGFDVAYVRQVYSPASTTVHVLTLPDTASLGAFAGTDPALVNDLGGTLLLVCVEVGSTERFLVARFLSGGSWSAPETLASDVTPGVRPRVCVDSAGLFWVAYCAGISSPPYWLTVRYYDGVWRAAEQVAPGGPVASPVLVPTYSGTIWLVWRGGTTQEQLFSSRRLSRPGVAERTASPGWLTANRLEVRPTVGSLFSLDGSADIYDASGRNVNRVDGRWSGQDRNGDRLEPGVYYLRNGGAQAKVVLR